MEIKTKRKQSVGRKQERAAGPRIHQDVLPLSRTLLQKETETQ